MLKFLVHVALSRDALCVFFFGFFEFEKTYFFLLFVLFDHCILFLLFLFLELLYTRLVLGIKRFLLFHGDLVALMRVMELFLLVSESLL